MSVLESPGNKVDPEKGSNGSQVAADATSEVWTSRGSFILASIGSAIGLGNFWRFPFLVYRWGGGSFFIPYIIALFVIGIPLLQLEFTLGQVFRRAGTQSFGRLSPRWAGIGLSSSMISFGIVGYYCAILGWSNVMLIESFYSTVPWSIRGLSGDDVIDVPVNHFNNQILHLSDDPAKTEIMASYVFAGSFALWASVWFILVRGQEFISKAVWVTVLLPVAILLFLLIFGCTLEGSMDGVHQYVGVWDMSQLKSKQMWIEAFSQILFSLSIAIGVMSGYASLNPRNQNIVQDAVIVACSNCCFSFIAGFAVFAIVGYMANGADIDFVTLNEQGLLSGSKLAFVAYPAGLSLLPGAGANVLLFFFFITVYMLGIDSAFSLVEAVVLNFRETAWFHHYSRTQLVSFFCFIGMMTTFMYTADIGLYLLDVVDYFVSTFGLPLLAFFETFVAGWIYNKDESVRVAGLMPVMLHDGLFWTAIVLFTGLTNGFANADTSTEFDVAVSFGVCVPLVVISFILPAFLASGQAGGFMEASYAIFSMGPDSLRIMLNDAICEGAPNNWRLPKVWALNVKYVMCPIMMYFVGINISGLAVDGGYGGYGPGYQVLGVILVIGLVTLLAIGWFKPAWYRDPALERSNSL
ncbi:Sodium-dependent noradrenaline transporter [Hondaea fermentalgiana]|uniref:Sodium-dependent noradrenaline transporter n=1 Tax=Hondaea fermentalgiana TaxID=2315210 RepID=A0A2R5GJT1_9STRA|nr:Sodium-dependent noradrenaline transporter [Hondaea fermentalgiana]|eukprot:GBG31152.1 Sodium-dependent noradrenaline transporter [Hondaea fermentalgiana]